MSETTSTIPQQQRPESCHVCGHPEDVHQHRSGDDRRGYGQLGHTFWSNADAMAEARAHDRRTTVVYPDGTTSPEAHAVATFAPEAVAR